MSDAELTELCALAMGWKHLGAVGVEPPKRGEPDPPLGRWCLSGKNDWWVNPEGHDVCAPCMGIPDPLHNDAQAMALVKRLRLTVLWTDSRFDGWRVRGWRIGKTGYLCEEADAEDLNRAITECAAKMQSHV